MRIRRGARISSTIMTIVMCITGLLLAIYPVSYLASAEASQTSLPKDEQLQQIEHLIKSQMDKSLIPGLAVTIVHGDETIYQQGFGFANVDKKQSVSPKSIFELGSTTKAFTGLGLLKLVAEGKLNLDDSVTDYIPWIKFHTKDSNRSDSVTLRQVLYQTSGIPFTSITSIPSSNDDTALRETIENLSGTTLDFSPGERFQYATINYDILGYVIEQVTNQSYEEYMNTEVLEPLGLQHTFLSKAEAETSGTMAQGYKLGYLNARPFDAPIYRGNTPAGYLYSDSNDMAQWLKIHLNTVPVKGSMEEIIGMSHMPDRTVSPDSDGSSYAAGWYVYQSGGGELSHSGNNPAYSSFVAFRPEEQVGVAVMANLNSSSTLVIGQGILDIMIGKEPVTELSDIYRTVDSISVVILAVSIPFMGLSLWFLGTMVRDILQRRRKSAQGWIKHVIRVFGFVLFAGGVGVAFLYIPQVLFNGVNWSFAEVWAPPSLKMAVSILYASLILFGLCMLLHSMFPGEGKRTPLFPFAVLCLVSGLGNTLIIFIINQALINTSSFQTGLFTFFLMGLAAYVISQKIVRSQLIRFTNDLIYQKQTEIINRILRSPYYKVEKVAKEKLYAVLNHDIETISGGINVLVFGLTSIITLIFCFIYLGYLNIYGLLISLLVVSLAALAYYVAGRHANKHWARTRDVQNVFYKYIGHMAQGFKELSLHQDKKKQFQIDMHDTCDEYRQRRIQGDIRFANVFVIGEILFTVVIGVVAFIFPILFDSVQSYSLSSFVFIFLYMGAPVRGVLDAVPDLIRVRIAWNRMNELAGELDDEKHSETNSNMTKEHQIDKFSHLELQDIHYEYVSPNGTSFSIGPINLTLRAGEITFITGGNGSGKSTLVKLLTGLYKPSSGNLFVNGKPKLNGEQSELFAAVFSEYHLFDKLYGLTNSLDKGSIDYHLEKLQLEQKVSIEDGKFSTTDLSSGQRRRLALLISYLEDRPVYLFDEWAADQDPEYRRYFYHHVLPELKLRGKCVIAVTHDDRYFEQADKLVKMEFGKMEMLDPKQHGSLPAYGT